MSWKATFRAKIVPRKKDLEEPWSLIFKKPPSSSQGLPLIEVNKVFLGEFFHNKLKENVAVIHCMSTFNWGIKHWILKSSVKDQGYEKALIKMKKKVKPSADKFY